MHPLSGVNRQHESMRSVLADVLAVDNEPQRKKDNALSTAYAKGSVSTNWTNLLTDGWHTLMNLFGEDLVTFLLFRCTLLKWLPTSMAWLQLTGKIVNSLSHVRPPFDAAAVAKHREFLSRDLPEQLRTAVASAQKRRKICEAPDEEPILSIKNEAKSEKVPPLAPEPPSNSCKMDIPNDHEFRRSKLFYYKPYGRFYGLPLHHAIVKAAKSPQLVAAVAGLKEARAKEAQARRMCNAFGIATTESAQNLVAASRAVVAAEALRAETSSLAAAEIVVSILRPPQQHHSQQQQKNEVARELSFLLRSPSRKRDRNLIPIIQKTILRAMKLDFLDFLREFCPISPQRTEKFQNPGFPTSAEDMPSPESYEKYVAMSEQTAGRLLPSPGPIFKARKAIALEGADRPSPLKRLSRGNPAQPQFATQGFSFGPDAGRPLPPAFSQLESDLNMMNTQAEPGDISVLELRKSYLEAESPPAGQRSFAPPAVRGATPPKPASELYFDDAMCESDPELLLRSYSTHEQVARFTRSYTKALFPLSLFGSEHNRDCILEKIDKFVRLTRFESMCMRELLENIKIRDMTWTECPKSDKKISLPASDHLKRERLAKSILKWLIEEFLIPLLRNTFYCTETQSHHARVFYYQRPVWMKLHQISFGSLIRERLMLTKLDTATASNMLKSRKLGIATIRFLPKANGVRPIMNLKNRLQVGKQTAGGYVLSVNTLMQQAKDVFSFETKEQPQLLASSLLSNDEIYERVISFVKNLRRAFGGVLPQLYMVKLDVNKAFDTIDQRRLFDEVLSKMLHSVRPRKLRVLNIAHGAFFRANISFLSSRRLSSPDKKLAARR